MRRSSIIPVLFCSIFPSVILYSCVTSPSNPYDVGKTRIAIIIKSAAGITGSSGIEDSLGNTIQIGASCNWWNYIDSIQFWQIAPAANGVKDSLIGVKTDLTKIISNDTIWKDKIFNETGMKSIKVIAFLNNGKIISDSGFVIIYSKSGSNYPPLWQQDTIRFSRQTGNTITVSLSDKCADPDKDSIKFSLISGLPQNDTIITGIYSFPPSISDTGIFFPRIAAFDTKGASDTITLRMTVTPVDSVVPKVIILSPAKDSSATNASSYTIELVCTDQSGIDSVAAKIGTSTFIGSKSSDSTWSIAVLGLTVNSYTEITVTATDKSINANKAKHTIYLKYDPNMLDSLGPIFRQLSGPRSGDTIKDPMVTIIDSIFDLSAVDSVYWSLNGSVRKSLEFLSNNHYRLSDTLKTYHLNRLVVYARDKSNRGNKDSSVISLNYNVPPEINDTILSTGKNAALPCTLRAQSADGDPLAWSMVAPISSSVGNINGSLPIITFTPTSDWIGADSFRVRVTDGKWSDTAKVKITVFSVPVGPKDVKITSQPAIDSIVAGQSISFSVTMNSDINPAPTFQWNHNGTAISGATSLSYAIGTVLPKDTGSYTVTVTNTVGSMTSPAFVLKVLVAPSITVQPNSATKCAGETVSLSVTASGTLPLSYQWKKGGDDATGVSNTGSYSIASVDTLHAGIYTCVISNAYGNITTQPCTLGVNVPISIVEHPASIKKWAGDTVTFSVKAKGSGALTYQWKKGNANIAGATSASYTISGINYFTDNDADYSCVVTNPCGSKTSNAAKLTVDAVKMAAGGDEHSLIVKMDGTLWVCGTNGYGQLGTGDTISRLKPVQIMTSVQSVACGDESSFIIRSDGSLWACGFNEAGGLGLGDQINRLQPTIVIQNVLTVAAGDAHCLIVKNDNTLWACGSNSNGQLGLGDMVDRFDPKYVMNNVSRVAAGGDHSFILKKDGTLYACGYNCYGVLGDGTMQNSPSPIQIKTNVSDIAISNYHSVILMSDKTVLACGENHFGQLGDGTTTERHLPVLVSTLTDVIKIASGSASYSMALKSDGTFWAFGNNSVGNLGDGTTQERHLPIKVNSEVAQFTSSDSHTLIIKTDGSLWGCGQNFYGQLGDGSTMDRHSWIQIKF